MAQLQTASLTGPRQRTLTIFTLLTVTALGLTEKPTQRTDYAYARRSRTLGL